MPVQMIELEEVMMVEASDEALESLMIVMNNFTMQIDVRCLAY